MAVSDPSLTLQKAIRQRLIASPELMALVQAEHILDANGRPEIMPAVYIGEGQTIFRRWDATTHATLHVWFAEPGLVQCKEAVSAIVAALRIDAQAEGVLQIDGFTVHDMQATQTRYLRDPHGSYSHGIVTAAAIVKPRAA
ncbi:DUF3168 domain-containing protein [Bradyrhizobium sp. RP6]|uniref:DUF3168 domain-containing protein n=1 Tax=Bradyrhizobium sp. RP6 TaxID=2489596 RepID=UPI000F52B3B6|nr:DUF3168 domain-containing protein [Bradyrhizobium sp. RP6]RQH14933.1 DUF3168 domain-containing protein [Bradyrhizobium sp. RP6]